MTLPIYTRNLVLSAFEESDIDDTYISWLNDKELMKHSRQRLVTHNYSSCLKYLATFQGTSDFFISINYSNIRKIGTATLYINKISQCADIGLLIGDKKIQGKGYGFEAWNALVDFAKKMQGLNHITAGTLSTNTPMRKIIEKSGFSLISENILSNYKNTQSLSTLSYCLSI